VVDALAIASIALRHFRNIERADLGDLPRFTVLSGDNGQGKTSVLEAVYFVCTTRSFRTSKLEELIRHHETAGGENAPPTQSPIASVRAIVRERGLEREQSVGLQGRARTVTLAGKRPPSLAAFAVQSPVVVFHPA